SPQEPDLPPNAGVAANGFDLSSWFAFLPLANPSPEISAKTDAAPAAALADPVTKERLEQQLGVVVVGPTPAELAAHLKSEMDKWGPVIKEAGITIRE